MPINRKSKKDQASPPPARPSSSDDENEEQEQEQEQEREQEQIKPKRKVVTNKQKNEEELIVPTSVPKSKVNVKMARFKVSIEDYDPERLKVQEPVKSSFEVDDEKKPGAKKKIEFFTFSFIYRYPERPMYTSASELKGTYPAEEGPCVISMPPAVSEYGLNDNSGKFYAFFLMKAANIVPETMNESDKEKLLKKNENLMNMAIVKFDRTADIIGEQLVKLHKAGKTSIDSLIDKKKTAQADEEVFKEDPGEVIEDFVKFQKRDQKVDRTLPRVIKLKMLKYRRGEIDNTNIILPDGEEIPPSDWSALQNKCITAENDIRLLQLYYNNVNIYLQTICRSMMVLDIADRRSTTTQEDRTSYWSEFDKDRVDSVRKKLEIANQKAKTKALENEKIKVKEEKGDEPSFDGIVNKKKNDTMGDEIDINKVPPELLQQMKAMMKTGGGFS